MNRLTEILNKIQNPATSPGELSEILLYLSADYSRQADELQQMLAKKAVEWPVIRKTVNSDKQADKVWDATPEGILETGLRIQLKSLEKLMSALRSHLRIKEIEARNQI